MTTDQVTTRRVVLSVGVGTGLLCLVVAALAAVALVAVTALHFVPSSAKPKIFPRLHSTPAGIPAAAIDSPQPDPVEAFGPVNREKLNEPKAFKTMPPPPFDWRTAGGDWTIAPPPPPSPPPAADEIIDEPKTDEETKGQWGQWTGEVGYRTPDTFGDGLKHVPQREVDSPTLGKKEGQSTCPNCPNYVPPSVGLRVVPRSPPPVYYPSAQPSAQPSYPSYLPPVVYPSPQPMPAPSSGGSWIQTAAGPVWLPSGYAYEHDSGLLRHVASGQHSRPSQTSRPAPLEPYRVPKLPEQPPLADDNLGNWSPRLNPAVPDFTKSPRGERKTGGYACANCRRPTVGDQWATQWTDEGTPISFLCRECWEKMTPQQRQTAYVEWYRRATE
jgi:hypothetical protein